MYIECVYMYVKCVCRQVCVPGNWIAKAAYTMLSELAFMLNRLMHCEIPFPID